MEQNLKKNQKLSSHLSFQASKDAKIAMITQSLKPKELLVLPEDENPSHENPYMTGAELSLVCCSCTHISKNWIQDTAPSLRGWVKCRGQTLHPSGCDNGWQFNFNLSMWRSPTPIGCSTTNFHLKQVSCVVVLRGTSLASNAHLC